MQASAHSVEARLQYAESVYYSLVKGEQYVSTGSTQRRARTDRRRGTPAPRSNQLRGTRLKQKVPGLRANTASAVISHVIMRGRSVRPDAPDNL